MQEEQQQKSANVLDKMKDKAANKSQRVANNLKTSVSNKASRVGQVANTKAVQAIDKTKDVAQKVKRVAKAIARTIKGVVKVVANPYTWIAAAAVFLFVVVMNTAIGMFWVYGENENCADGGVGSSIGTGSGDYNPGQPGVDYFPIDQKIFDANAHSTTDWRTQRMKLLGPMAQKAVAKVKKETGVSIPASVLLAQTIMESNAGSSPIAQERNNLGGMGCFDGQENEKCMYFPSYEAYFEYAANNYAKNSAYKHCLGAQNWAEFSECAFVPYATAANPKHPASKGKEGEYVSLCAAFISAYQLDQYDGGYNVKPVNVKGFSASSPTSGSGACQGSLSGRPLSEAVIKEIEARGIAFKRTKEGLLSYQQLSGSTSTLPLTCGTVNSCGCGPTSFLSAATALTGKFIEPAELYKKANEKGAMKAGVGASHSLPDLLAPEFGLRSENLGYSATVSQINDALSKGGMVWTCGGGPAPFTAGGHCVVIRGKDPSGKWLFFDSAGRDADVGYDPSFITTYNSIAVALYPADK